MRVAFCWLCLSLAFAGVVRAQQAAEFYTLQVFAFATTDRAAEVSARLRAVGFDAYLETSPGSRWVQVRIGCFAARMDAEGLLRDVRRRVSGDALMVPMTPGARVGVCVARDLGFIPPEEWGVSARSAEGVSFRIGGQPPRYLVFDGRWRVAQTEAELTAAHADPEGGARPSPLRVRYRATRSGDLPLVRADLSGGSLLIAAGELLWHSEDAAVVQLGSEVVALRLFGP